MLKYLVSKLGDGIDICFKVQKNNASVQIAISGCMDQCCKAILQFENNPNQIGQEQ